MINRLKLHKLATYTDPVEIFPNKINYFYGSNGTGKTTLSDFVSDATKYNNCELDWKHTHIETVVYNKKFVEENFNQSRAIKGIFTLGKENAEAVQKIEILRTRLDGLSKEFISYNTTIEGKKILIEKERREIEEKCWQQKLNYEEIFKPAFVGLLKSKNYFFEKCLEEQNSKCDLLPSDDLVSRAKQIYENDLSLLEEPAGLNYDDLSQVEESPILTERIISNNDSYLLSLIDKLKNIDWVRSGINYLEHEKSTCPFCQQEIHHNIADDIKSIFDETYINKCTMIRHFKENYILYFEDKLASLRLLAKVQNGLFSSKDLLISQSILLKEIYKNNVTLIESKEQSPSLEIVLESTKQILDSISLIIENYRSEVIKNNQIIQNIAKEKEVLKKQIWRFIAEKVRVDIDFYKVKIGSLEKAVKSLDDKMKLNDNIFKSINEQIEDLEVSVTNVVHTVNQINKLLRLFSFTNFKVIEAYQNKGFYQIVREDGSEVKKTLSEGESTFITFLYFYQLIQGSTDNTGVNNEKVVVFDDPISSLDSSVLFVVSSLIKDIISKVLANVNNIKQVFVLTHNIYFYKEVTFKGIRRKDISKEETYWTIRKINGVSKITKHEENPVKTTYEILWNEINDIDKINKGTVFNTLRRILEYYFNIIGGIDYESCIEKFEDDEKFFCKSLIAWMHDGSHFISEDLVLQIDDEQIEKYLYVFELIFERTGHKSHYDMMISKVSKVE